MNSTVPIPADRSQFGFEVTNRLTRSDGSPALGRAGEYGVRFEIVHGGMNTTKNASFGLLTVALNGDADAVERYLDELKSVSPVQEVAQ